MTLKNKIWLGVHAAVDVVVIAWCISTDNALAASLFAFSLGMMFQRTLATLAKEYE